MALDAQSALLLAAAGHAGFQLTVTAMVYPALVTTRVEDWERVHARHSRAIVPLVVAAYGALVLAGAWALVAGPVGVALLVALGTAVATVVLTGAVAAPLHGRLGREGPDPALLRRLLVVDRARAALALVTLLWALAWALTT